MLANSPDESYAAFVDDHAARKLKKPVPKDGEVFNFMYDIEKGFWRPWMDTVEKQEIPATMEYTQIMVTTLDVVRYTHIMRMLIQNHSHVLLVGPTGTGKSRYITNLLASMDTSEWSSLVFNFSARTSANMTQVSSG